MEDIFLVILDPSSVIGQMHAENADRYAVDGRLRCPVLECERIDSSGSFLFARRVPLGRMKGKAGPQNLYIRYQDVVCIHELTGENKSPVGFVYE